MLRWIQSVLPREEGFYDLFEAHAATLTDAAGVLRLLLDGGDRVPEYCRQVAAYEHQADLVTRDVMLAVRRTFITPFDRSDIRALTTAMDDAIDQMHKTAKTITLFDVRRFEPIMATMGDIIVQTAAVTAEALPLLRSMRTNAARLNVLTERITQLEEQSDNLYDEGMRALFDGPGRDDWKAFVVGREIYEHLEKVVDRFEDVADQISGVLIEHL
jgi:predicted phosphate transport protein (TIGR00153 family)